MFRASGHLTALFTAAVVCLTVVHLRFPAAINLLAALVELQKYVFGCSRGCHPLSIQFFPDQL
jgi:hypothetical protein